MGATSRLVLATACAVALAAAGCGEEEDPNANVDETATLGPTSAEGDVEATKATLRAQDGYTTLVTSQAETRGNQDTLVAGQVELIGGKQPQFRIKVDGKPAKGTSVDVTEDDGKRVAVISCACKFPTGDHDVVLEGATKSETASVGARTLVVFAEVQLDDTGAAPVSGSTLVTDETKVVSEGATLAQASSEGGEGGGPLLVLASVAAPRTGTGSENVRLEVEIGGDTTDEAAKTTIPNGKLVAYLDEDGAGDDVTLRGYTTAGETPVGVASLILCNCGLAR